MAEDGLRGRPVSRLAGCYSHRNCCQPRDQLFSRNALKLGWPFKEVPPLKAMGLHFCISGKGDCLHPRAAPEEMASTLYCRPEDHLCPTYACHLACLDSKAHRILPEAMWLLIYLRDEGSHHGPTNSLGYEWKIPTPEYPCKEWSSLVLEALRQIG